MSWWPVRVKKMVLVFLVHFSALCSVVFTHTDSLDKGNSQTSFEFRDVKRSDASDIVSSFQKTLRCVKSEPSNLKLAAFNVRTFGTKKMATPGVPEILVKVSSAAYLRWMWHFIEREIYYSCAYLLLCFDRKLGDLSRAMIGVLAKSSLSKTTRNDVRFFSEATVCVDDIVSWNLMWNSGYEMAMIVTWQYIQWRLFKHKSTWQNRLDIILTLSADITNFVKFWRLCCLVNCISICMLLFTTIHRFKNANCKFYYRQISEATKTKRILTWKQRLVARPCLRKFRANEALWWHNHSRNQWETVQHD